MNKTIHIFAVANAILFVFIIPFIVVYLHFDRMYSRSSDLAIVYAAETGEKVEIELASVAQTRVAEAEQKKAAEKAGAHRVSWSSSLDLVSTQNATQILPLVAQCESGDDPQAQSSISTAKGWLQILDGTWQAFSCSGYVVRRYQCYSTGAAVLLREIATPGQFNTAVSG